MNKRIHRNDETLIGRLSDIAHEETVRDYNERMKTEHPSDVIFYDMFNQRLGELIVRECMEVVQKSQWEKTNGEYYEGFNEALNYGAIKIKKHFGVD